MQVQDVRDAVIDALEHSNSFELKIHYGELAPGQNAVIVFSKNGRQTFEIKVTEIGKRK